MSGLLIYSAEEARRNAFAVQKFCSLLDCRLVDEKYRGEADFVINRTNDYRVAEHYEKKGVRVFNPSALSRLANDKQACYDFMEAHGIEIMPTRYSSIPVVKKAVDGHGGSEVFMLDTAEDFEAGYVYQKPCDCPGRDVRTWLIGGEIVASILRESRTDFRSNYCLGGSASVYELSREERELVYRISALVPSDYIGIDFIFNGGHFVFNEIEDTVGARMLYDLTDVDILAMYCDYIKENIG